MISQNLALRWGWGGGLRKTVNNAFTTSAEPSPRRCPAAPEAFRWIRVDLSHRVAPASTQRCRNLGKKGGRDYQEESEKG